MKIFMEMPGPIVHIEVFDNHIGILYWHPRRWWQFWKAPKTLVFKSFRIDDLDFTAREAVEDFKGN